VSRFVDSHDSPCIGFCSTTFGDPFCRGCYRSVREVIQWASLPLEEKKAYYRRLHEVIEPYLKEVCFINDRLSFEQLCQRFNVVIYQDYGVFFALWQLLQKGALPLLSDRHSGVMKRTSSCWLTIKQELEGRVRQQQEEEARK
jgi:predicted Fe-S protein YdhL (DUF1289 family)